MAIKERSVVPLLQTLDPSRRQPCRETLDFAIGHAKYLDQLEWPIGKNKNSLGSESLLEHGRQTLPCGHVLHESCVREMLRLGRWGRCTQCRETSDDLTPFQELAFIWFLYGSYMGPYIALVWPFYGPYMGPYIIFIWLLYGSLYGHYMVLIGLLYGQARGPYMHPIWSLYENYIGP